MKMQSRFGLALVAILFMVGCAGRNAADSKPLVSVSGAESIGYATLWTSNLSVPKANRISHVVAVEDMVLVTETPSNFVTAMALTDGRVLWSQPVGGKWDRVLGASRSGKQVVVSTETDMYILAANDGRLLYMHRLEETVGAPPVVINDLAIFGGITGRVFAQDINSGLSRWAYKLANRIQAPPTLVGNTVVVSDGSGNIVMLTTDGGQLIWTNLAFGPVVAAVAVTPATVYIPSTDSTLYAINRATGRDRWKFPATEPLAIAPVVAGNFVLQALPSGKLVALDANDGSVKWRRDDLNVVALLVNDRGVIVQCKDCVEVVDPATGQTRAMMNVASGVQAVVPTPGNGLIIASPRGRLARMAPAK